MRRGNKGESRSIKKRSFGSVIAEARRQAGLTQKDVVGLLRSGEVARWRLSNFSSLEHDQRYRPSDEMVEKLAEILGVSADVLYYYANRIPRDLRLSVENEVVEGAYEAFRRVLKTSPRCGRRR